MTSDTLLLWYGVPLTAIHYLYLSYLYLGPTDHVPNQEVISHTGSSSIGDIISCRHLGLFGHVPRLDSGVPNRDALQCAYARRTEIRPPSGWRRPPGRPRQTWLHQIGDGCEAITNLVQPGLPPSDNNGTLQSDVDIPGKCHHPSILIMIGPICGSSLPLGSLSRIWLNPIKLV